MTAYKLDDLQLIILSAASQHQDGSLIPLPAAAASDLTRAGKAIAALMRKGLAEETPVTDRRLAWRSRSALATLNTLSRNLSFCAFLLVGFKRRASLGNTLLPMGNWAVISDISRNAAAWGLTCSRWPTVVSPKQFAALIQRV